MCSREQRQRETERQWKVDRVTANHSLSSTASQGTSNIPFPCFLVLGCNRQAQEHISYHQPYNRDPFDGWTLVNYRK